MVKRIPEKKRRGNLTKVDTDSAKFISTGRSFQSLREPDGKHSGLSLDSGAD